MAKVYIWMPAVNGSIPIEMASFLMALQKTTKHSVSVSFLPRADISHARNELIKDFLKTDNDYLLYLDDDNPPESIDFLDKLIEAKKPVISWLVPSRLPDGEWRHRLCIFQEWMKETWEHEYIQQFNVPSGEVIEIANCGMGCVLIEREVVKLVVKEFDRPCEMRMVWYYWDEEDREWIRDERTDYAKLKDGTLRFKRYMSEDLLFFERAKEFGIKLYANTGVKCTHIWNPSVISIKQHIKW